MNNTTKRPQCKQCLYYEDFGPSQEDGMQNEGICQRFPPSGAAEGVSVFPFVFSESWCGEWKPIDGIDTRTYGDV